MKYAFWGFGLLMAGIFGLMFIVMFESITVNNESEYYNLKEAMEASMIESIDLACFRNSNVSNDTIEVKDKRDVGCNGTIKIVEQKFVENFTRRFVASISGDAASYQLEFLDIIEAPPKASVVIRANTQDYNFLGATNSSFKIVNDLSGIIEAKDWEYIKSLSNAINVGGNGVGTGNSVGGNSVGTGNNNSVENSVSSRRLNVKVPGIFNIVISGVNVNRPSLLDGLKSKLRRVFGNCCVVEKNDNSSIRIDCRTCPSKDINLYDERIRSALKYNDYRFTGWSSESSCYDDSIIARTGEKSVSKKADGKTFYACFSRR